MTNRIEVMVEGLDKAKWVAGEWVAMFNQDVEGDEPMIVTMISPEVVLENGCEPYKVAGYYASGEAIPNEEVMNAEDVVKELAKAGQKAPAEDPNDPEDLDLDLDPEPLSCIEDDPEDIDLTQSPSRDRIAEYDDPEDIDLTL